MNEMMFDRAYSHSHDHEHQRHYATVFSKEVTLSFSTAVKSSEPIIALEDWVREMVDWSDENDGLVGHIKAYIGAPVNVWLSSTGGRVKVSGQADCICVSGDLAVCATAIIVGVDQKVLKCKGELALEEKLGQWFIS